MEFAKFELLKCWPHKQNEMDTHDLINQIFFSFDLVLEQLKVILTFNAVFAHFFQCKSNSLTMKVA